MIGSSPEFWRESRSISKTSSRSIPATGSSCWESPGPGTLARISSRIRCRSLSPERGPRQRRPRRLLFLARGVRNSFASAAAARRRKRPDRRNENCLSGGECGPLGSRSHLRLRKVRLLEQPAPRSRDGPVPGGGGPGAKRDYGRPRLHPRPGLSGLAGFVSHASRGEILIAPISNNLRILSTPTSTATAMQQAATVIAFAGAASFSSRGATNMPHFPERSAGRLSRLRSFVTQRRARRFPAAGTWPATAACPWPTNGTSTRLLAASTATPWRPRASDANIRTGW